MDIDNSWWLHIVPFFMNTTDGDSRLSHWLRTHVTADDSRLSHCLWTYVTENESVISHSLWILHGFSKIRIFFNEALVTTIITANERDRISYSWQIWLTLVSGWHAATHKRNFHACLGSSG
jgi:hypothetical protein